MLYIMIFKDIYELPYFDSFTNVEYDISGKPLL